MDQAAHLRNALIGRYEIIREIGAGGMATVYLARDVKHDRNVALKVLKPELGAVLGVERFLSEIRVTANLQHPNLLPLFDSGEADGLLFYVMPFVEGETLRARLDREQQLPIDEALRISSSIASALAYAHAHGVIHRDLKPENILLQAGQPVISDFGIALAVSNAGGTRVTQTGISLGTPQYMSPEQAAGDRTIDARSDIYSLGAMTYEMLAGTPPHSGGSAQAVIAKLMTADPPPLLGLRPTTPSGVARAVGKALARVPADRFATAERFADAIQSGAAAPPDLRGVDALRSRRASWLHQPASLALLAVVAALAGIVAWTRVHVPAPPPAGAVRFNLMLPKGAKLSANVIGALAAISPDGGSIAYVGELASGGRQLWLRDMDQLAPRPLSGTENAETPQFTPDGQNVLFVDGLTFTRKMVPRAGGAVTSIVSDPGFSPAVWTNDDSILFAGGSTIGRSLRLLRVSTAGGPPAQFFSGAALDAAKAYGFRMPWLAADHQTLFFTLTTSGPPSTWEIGASTLRDRQLERTGIVGIRVLGYANERLFFVDAQGALMVIPFDLHTRKATGQAMATGDVSMMDNWGARADLSSGGHLAFVAGSLRSSALLVGRNGATARVGSDDRLFSWARYSPDGKSIAFCIGEGSRTDIWVFHVATANFERLTSEGTSNDRPEWWPDGRSVVFRSNRDGRSAFFRQPADASGPAVRLTPPLDVDVQELVVSPDGRTLLLRVDTPNRARDILSLPVGGTVPAPFIATAFDELTPRFSPNGRWVAYTSNESGRDEIYVRAFPGPGGRTIISDAGGNEPLWSRDGKTLFYRSGQRFIAATVSTAGEVQVMGREQMLEGNYSSNRLHPMYDVDPVTARLLVFQPLDGELDLTVVLNWAQSIKALARPAK